MPHTQHHFLNFIYYLTIYWAFCISSPTALAALIAVFFARLRLRTLSGLPNILIALPTAMPVTTPLVKVLALLPIKIPPSKDFKFIFPCFLIKTMINFWQWNF
jgi:hypothetical protein